VANHAPALLARVAPLLAYDRRGKRRRRHNQDQEFNVVDGVGDLLLDAVIGPGHRLGLLREAAVPHGDGGRGPKIGPKHQHGGTAMEHYAAIDVSLEWSRGNAS
jgi:hypothetical protein